MFLPMMTDRGYPEGLLGRLLSRHRGILQTISFLDNERGERAALQTGAALRRRVVDPVNFDLRRGRKGVEVEDVKICRKEHGTIIVSYRVRGQSQSHQFRALLFKPTRQALARAKARAAGKSPGRASPPAAPRRGTSERSPRKSATPRKRRG